MAINAGDAIWKISGEIGDLQSALSEATSAVQSTTSEAESAATIAISGDSTELESTLDSVASDVSSTVSDASGDATVEVSGDSSDLDTTLESVSSEVSSAVDEATGNATVEVDGDSAPLESTLDSVAETVDSAVGSVDATVVVEADASQAESEMDSLADSATAAAAEAESAFPVEATADASQAEGALDQLTEKAAMSAQDIAGSLSTIGTSMTVLGVGITGALGGALAMWTNYGSEIKDASDRTGVATEALSELKFILEQNGTQLSAFEMAQRNLTRAMGEAEAGEGAQAEALTQLGLSYESLRAMKPDEQFKAVAFAIGQAGDYTTQAQLAMELFGARVATQLMPMIKNGQAGFDELAAKARELGIVMDEEAAAKTEEFGDTVDQLYASFQGAVIQIGPLIAEIAEKLIPVIVDAVTGVRDWVAANPELTTTLISVAGAVGMIFAVLGPLLMMMPGVVALFTAGNAIIGLFGASAAVAAPAVAGIGTAAATAAGPLGVGGLVTALAGVALPVAAGVAIGLELTAIGLAAWETKKAYDALAESEVATAAREDAYIQKLQQRGAWLDANAAKAMEGVAQAAYIAEANTAAADTMARAWFEYFAGRTETEQEFAQMRNLMLNEQISAEEAAIAVSKDLATQTIRELMQANEQQTQAMLEQLGIREQAELQTTAVITNAAMESAAQRTQLDMEANNQMSLHAAQAAEEAARSWFSWISDAWNGLQQLFGKAASFQNLSQDLYAAMYPPGPGQQRAAGGPVQSNKGYLVGEEGPEWFQPNVSGSIFNARETASMAGAGAGGVTINISGVNVASDYDVDRLARTLGDRLRQRLTGVGHTSSFKRA